MSTENPAPDERSNQSHEQIHDDYVPSLEYWRKKYPDTIKTDVDLDRYTHLLEVFHGACHTFRNRPAFSNMGVTITYGDLDRLSSEFASFLQHHTDLKPGDRLAIQLPNLLQYPVALFGALRAGLVVVNTNPLYTAREMKHQFKDSGARALVVLENFAALAQSVIPETNIKTVVVCRMGDLFPFIKRHLVNQVVKRVKKMVPAYDLDHIKFKKALRLGAARDFVAVSQPKSDDIAVLQYTGGTTGVAKGAMLTHRNLVSNMLQTNALLSQFKPGEETIIAPLPLYHIFCFTVSCMAILELGCHSVLITNPRDIPGFIKTLRKTRFSAFAGLNTLFVALMKDPNFKSVDWQHLKLTISGGMALQKSVADEWQERTGCQICEGFGMTETSPVVCVNPPNAIQIGTIGLPVPGTLIKIMKDGEAQPMGSPGELWVKGPQVMKGYWERPEATAETITSEGWLKTGDIALIQEDGYTRIVDRIKDMILVSGFNVYPNEIEGVIASHEKVLECAAIGVPCEKSGEKVKLFVVKKDPSLTEQELIAFAKENLTGYKVPKVVEFRDDLPKSNVGKILRRELRD